MHVTTAGTDAAAAATVVLSLGKGERGRQAGSSSSSEAVAEVSLTILRNFADSLARVDHVRPARACAHRSPLSQSHGMERGKGGSSFELA